MISYTMKAIELFIELFDALSCITVIIIQHEQHQT